MSGSRQCKPAAHVSSDIEVIFRDVPNLCHRSYVDERAGCAFFSEDDIIVIMMVSECLENWASYFATLKT